MESASGMAAAAIVGTVLLVFVTMLGLAWVSRSDSTLPLATAFNAQLNSAPWYKNLNLGACVLAPWWLFCNGMWLCAIVYLILAWLLPPLALVASLLLLFRGTRLSWGGGARWGNDVEAFLDEQHFWSTLSWVALLVWSAVAIAVVSPTTI